MFEKIRNWWNKFTDPEICEGCNINTVEDPYMGCCEACWVADMKEFVRNTRQVEHMKMKNACLDALKEFEKEKK